MAVTEKSRTVETSKLEKAMNDILEGIPENEMAHLYVKSAFKRLHKECVTYVDPKMNDPFYILPELRME